MFAKYLFKELVVFCHLSSSHLFLFDIVEICFYSTCLRITDHLLLYQKYIYEIHSSETTGVFDTKGLGI